MTPETEVTRILTTYPWVGYVSEPWNGKRLSGIKVTGETEIRNFGFPTDHRLKKSGVKVSRRIAECGSTPESYNDKCTIRTITQKCCKTETSGIFNER